jgi:hypothetical protein
MGATASLAEAFGGGGQSERSPESDDLSLQVSWLRGRATGGTCSCGEQQDDCRDTSLARLLTQTSFGLGREHQSRGGCSLTPSQYVRPERIRSTQ